jgi:hypothetical protein
MQVTDRWPLGASGSALFWGYNSIMRMPPLPPILPSPKNPRIRLEPACDCDGTECDRVWSDEEGNSVDLPAHYHLIESEDGASTICHAIGGGLPARGPAM